MNLLKNHLVERQYFQTSLHRGLVEDDHIPFLLRGTGSFYIFKYKFNNKCII